MNGSPVHDERYDTEYTLHDERIAFRTHMKSVTLIHFEINPYFGEASWDLGVIVSPVSRQLSNILGARQDVLHLKNLVFQFVEIGDDLPFSGYNTAARHYRPSYRCFASAFATMRAKPAVVSANA